MTYITGGDVVDKRSPWRFSIVTDLFWGAIDFVGLFVTSIFSDPSTALRPNSNISQGRRTSHGNDRRKGPRQMGQVKHRSPPVCGGCCG